MKVKLSPRVLNYILLLACASPLWCQATTPQSSANQATHFLVTAPSSATGATAFQFTVKALNASNRVVTGYSGTVHFTSTDAKAVLPANSKLSSGAGAFSAKLNTAGKQTIRATDTLTSSFTGASAGIAVKVVTSISIAPQKLIIFLKSSQPFDAVAVFSDKSVQDVTTTAKWVSSAPTDASVSSAGVVTGLKAGDASISAELGAIKASTSVTISSSKSGVTLVDDFTDSRLMTYQPGDGSHVTYVGSRNSKGLAAAITSVTHTASDGKSQALTFDSQGRLSLANASDGSQLSINWSNPSAPVMTVISADHTQIAAAVIPIPKQTSAERSPGASEKRSLWKNVEPFDDSTSPLQKVNVTSCNYTIPENGAFVTVTKSGTLGGSPIKASLIGDGEYGVYLPSGPTGLTPQQLAQAVQGLLDNICGPGFTSPTNLKDCGYLGFPWAVAACVVAVGAYDIACNDQSDIVDGATAVINYIISQSPSVDLIANANLNLLSESDTLFAQPPLGPYQDIRLDFPCPDIDHVTVTGPSQLYVGQPEPFEATAVNVNSQIITSSALEWSWFGTEGVEVVPNGVYYGIGDATVTGKEASTSLLELVTATATLPGLSSKSGSETVTVSCSANGNWSGTYISSDVSGSVIASLTQTGMSITGTASVDGTEGNVTGTNNAGQVSFGPIVYGDMTLTATDGSFSSNCGILSGDFVLQGTDTVVGTYAVTM